MTVAIERLIKDRYEIQKQLRAMSKNRTNKKERMANRAKRRSEKAKRDRLKTFNKCLAYRAGLDDIKKAN